MRPQGFGQVGGGLEDLGWDDMGFEPPRPAAVPRDEGHDAFGDELPVQPMRNPLAALTPVQSPVHDQQTEIEDRFFPSPEAPEEDEDEEFDETAELYDPESAPAEPESAAAESVPAPVVAPAPVEEPVGPAPVAEQFVAAPPLSPVARRVRKPRSAAGSKAKAAFTLRLEPDRHLKLRLACAVAGCSAQQLVTDALDQLLAGMPEVDAMAAKARRKE
jgi:hypothetical protein